MASFVDTNILIYSISDSGEAEEQRKAILSADLLQRRDDLVLSVQVLQEFYVQATRPSRPGALSHELAVEFIESWKRFRVVDITPAVLDEALKIRASTGFQYWDCAILASAQLAGCTELLTEDLQDGRTIGDVAVINPFAALRPA